jgi:hypothetical protein
MGNIDVCSVTPISRTKFGWIGHEVHATVCCMRHCLGCAFFRLTRKIDCEILNKVGQITASPPPGGAAALVHFMTTGLL